MSLRGLILGACAGLGAVLVALAAWKAADAVSEAVGLGALRPLVIVTVLFLSLTVLQAAWDRIERCSGEREGSWYFSERRALKICMGVARALVRG